MRLWVKILPFFVVEWLCRHYGLEVLPGAYYQEDNFVSPFRDVYFRVRKYSTWR